MKGHPIAYSAAEMAWLEANRVMKIGDYHRVFVEAFGRADVSAVNLHSLRKRKGWRTGRTGRIEPGTVPHNKGKPFNPPGSEKGRFKAGSIPPNRTEIGTERIGRDGYIEMCVDRVNPYTGHSRRYMHKHRYLWEQDNGPLPKGMALKSLDGDRTNCDPANWEAIPRALLPLLNGGRFKRSVAYDDAAPELRPTVLAVAKLKHRVREVRKSA